MSNPLTLEELRELIENRVRELSDDPGSLLKHGEASDFPFVPLGRTANRGEAHGHWVEGEGSDVVKVFRLIGEIRSARCGPYGAIYKPKEMSEYKATHMSAKFTLALPGSLGLDSATEEMLKRQASVLNEMQVTREEDPTYVHSHGEGDDAVEIMITGSVRGGIDGAEIDIFTPPIFDKKKKPNGPSRDLYSSSAEAIGPDGQKVETMETWSDPLQAYRKIKFRHLYRVRKDIDIMSLAGERVHPSQFDKEIRQGMWVVVDVYMRLWNYTKPKEEGGNRGRSYKLIIEQMQPLTMPVLQVKEEKAPVRKRERSLSSEIVVSTPKKRPFGSVVGTPSSSFSSTEESTMLRQSTPLVWSPSPSMSEEVPVDAADEDQSNKRGTRGGRASRAKSNAKGKGKAKAFSDDDMSE